MKVTFSAMYDGDGKNTDIEQSRMLVTPSQPILAPQAFSPLVHYNPWTRHSSAQTIFWCMHYHGYYYQTK